MKTVDWDLAFDNRRRFDDPQAIFDRNAEWAQAFRTERQRAGEIVPAIPYGAHTRERIDLFRRGGGTRGLVVFIHGGYWKDFDRTDWSHLAEGPLRNGWAVAMPGYTLCPEGTVPGIVRQVARAVEHAASLVPGPIRLVGHSAGGQIAARLVAERTPLAPGILKRVERTVTISGVHDLVPLTETTELNATLGLSREVAAAESPARLERATAAPVAVWVGADESPEFLRQAALLRDRWRAPMVIEPDRHHFDVVEELVSGGKLLHAVAGDG